LTRKALAALALTVLMTPAAYAAEPRPWLCRDKPVFSSQQPMNYHVTMTSRSRWQLFLMQFTPGAGQDGFDIAQTISRSSTGQLAAGRYFAVALRNSGGNWICPPVVSDQPARGAVSHLCFATDDGECNVELVVTPATPAQ
jgi:hypothetical protein